MGKMEVKRYSASLASCCLALPILITLICPRAPAYTVSGGQVWCLLPHRGAATLLPLLSCLPAMKFKAIGGNI